MKMNRKILVLLISGLFLTFPAVVLAQGPTHTDPRGTAGYLSYVEGEVFFQNIEKAEEDMAVLQGDELLTEKGKAEVYLGSRNWLRLDQHTRVTFARLQKDSIKLSVGQGSIYLHLESKPVEVVSPRENFYADNGLYRVDVEKNKAKIYENPRVVDRFDGWNYRCEEELNRSEGEPYYDNWAYSYPWGPNLNIWWSPYWYWPSWSYYGYLGWYSFYYPYYYGPYYYGRTTLHRRQLQRPIRGGPYLSGLSSRSFSRGMLRFSSVRSFSRSPRRH